MDEQPNTEPIITTSNDSELVSQLKENKGLIIALVVVLGIGGYVLFGSGGGSSNDPAVNDPELDAQLAELQSNQPSPGAQAIQSYDGTDQRNISLGSEGASDASPAVFRTDEPVIDGVLVGYGTKTDNKGEYLVAYVAVDDTPGYEVDLRELIGYTTERPVYLVEGNRVRVYGTIDRDNKIIAEAIL